MSGQSEHHCTKQVFPGTFLKSRESEKSFIFPHFQLEKQFADDILKGYSGKE